MRNKPIVTICGDTVLLCCVVLHGITWHMSDVVDDFNEGLILPTLIRQLKSILDQYPDDGQILKVSFVHTCVEKRITVTRIVHCNK